MLSIFTKDGMRYVFDERVVIVYDPFNCRTEYAYAHWLARFVV